MNLCMLTLVESQCEKRSNVIHNFRMLLLEKFLTVKILQFQYFVLWLQLRVYTDLYKKVSASFIIWHYED